MINFVFVVFILNRITSRSSVTSQPKTNNKSTTGSQVPYGGVLQQSDTDYIFIFLKIY